MLGRQARRAGLQVPTFRIAERALGGDAVLIGCRPCITRYLEQVGADGREPMVANEGRVGLGRTELIETGPINRITDAVRS